MTASVDLALYPSNSTNINNHLLRVPGIYDVLVGHGDSDEPESRSPLARMYDEIWVAGPAGRERYAYPVSGVPDAKITEIGPIRPPLPARGSSGSRPTVVYAPTWENVVDAVDLSSLMAQGRRIVDALLARQDVRVLFVPAAPTGARIPAARVAVESLQARIASAGGDHATWSADRLPEALALASFVVVDVSPALAEAVRFDVPFAVPGVAGISDAGMVAEFPSTAAGAVLLATRRTSSRAIDDALGEDVHARRAPRARPPTRCHGRLHRALPLRRGRGIAVQRRRRAFAAPPPRRGCAGKPPPRTPVLSHWSMCERSEPRGCLGPEGITTHPQTVRPGKPWAQTPARGSAPTRRTRSRTIPETRVTSVRGERIAIRDANVDVMENFLSTREAWPNSQWTPVSRSPNSP